MLQVTPLYSSSSGNCVLVSNDGYHFLIDAGKTYNKLRKALAIQGVTVEQLQAVFVSHQHGDHVHAIPKLCKANPFLTVYSEANNNLLPEINLNNHKIKVKPFSLDHDDPCTGYTIEADGYKVVYVSDTGSIPCESLAHMLDPTVLIVEANWDVDTMLSTCPYRDELKGRICDTHLNINQTCELIELLKWAGLEQVVLWHLSGNSINRDLAIDQAERSAQFGDNKGGVKVSAADKDTALPTIVLM